MQACQQLLYRGTLRLLSIYRDNSVSQETLPIVLEVVGHVWPLLPMIAISSCSTYVTSVWLQQQPKTWYSSTNCQKSVETKCSTYLCVPTVFWSNSNPTSSNGNMGLTPLSPALLTCWLGLSLSSDECRFNLCHADGRERVYSRWESVLLLRKWPCSSLTSWVDQFTCATYTALCWQHSHHIMVCIAQNGGHIRYWHISLNLQSLFVSWYPSKWI